MPKPVRTARQIRNKKLQEEPLKRAFLRAYTVLGTTSAAAKIVQMRYHRHLRWLAKDPEYAKAFENAAEVHRLQKLEAYEKEIDRRAIEGFDEPVFQGGVLVGVKRKFSDVLAIFRTKKLDPAYRDNFNQQINVQTNVQNNQIRVVEDGNWYNNADRLASGSADKSDTDPPV